MRHALMAAVAISALASPAMAQDRGFYAGIEAGILFPKDSTLHAFLTDGTDTTEGDVAKIDYNHGFDGDIIAGYDFGMVRLEAELGYKRASHHGYAINEGICYFICGFGQGETGGPVTAAVAPAAVEGAIDVGGDGHTRVWSIMANALLDFDVGNRFRIYAGPGIGYHSTRITYDVTYEDEDFDIYRLSDNGFAWQAIAGMAYGLNDNVDLGLKYRYFRTNRLEETDDFSSYSATGSTRFKSHSLLASLIYNFAAPAPPAPPPPPPPPEPAPAPATQTCYDGSVILATDVCPSPPPPPPPPPAPERG